MRFCNICDTIFEDYAITKNNWCMVYGCCGEIIELDDNLYQAYSVFHSKGYLLRDGSVGKSYSPFSDGIETLYKKAELIFEGMYMFPSLPDGFESKHIENKDSEIWVNDWTTILYKNYDRDICCTKYQKEIWKTSLDILEWVESLEEMSEDEFLNAVQPT